MTGPAPAGLFVYAKTLATMAAFYETLLAMTRVHASDDLVVLQSPDIQLVLHAIPRHIADEIVIDVPPQPREDAALKFFFTVPSLDAARAMAPGLGGAVMAEAWRGAGFVACNACDPEGNIFQLRERSV
jgi:catechol 2,3-dioxygenase-like lactoylglutathione lyase family enzyme